MRHLDHRSRIEKRGLHRPELKRRQAWQSNHLGWKTSGVRQLWSLMLKTRATVRGVPSFRYTPETGVILSWISECRRRKRCFRCKVAGSLQKRKEIVSLMSHRHL